jgi:hypothetical protein
MVTPKRRQELSLAAMAVGGVLLVAAMVRGIRRLHARRSSRG